MLRAVRIHWTLPLLVAAIAVVAQILWEQLGQPTSYAAASRLEVRRGTATETGYDPAWATWALALEQERQIVLARASRLLTGDAPAGDALDREFAVAVKDLAASFDAATISSLPLLSMVGLTSLDGSTVVFQAEAGTAELARAIAWATGFAAREWFEERTGKALREERSELTAKERALVGELKRAIQERLDFSRRVGAIDVSRHTELIKRLILEIDEETSRLEIQRLDLARMINERRLHAMDREVPDEAVPPDRTEANEEAANLERAREELLQARLEYEVQIPVLTRRHPRMMRIQKRILDLESRVTKSVGPESDDERRGSPDPVLLNTYRTLSLKLDTLEKKRETLTQEFKRLSRIRPETDRIEKGAAMIESRLGPLRDRLGDVNWQLSQLTQLARVQPPTAATALPRPLIGWAWTFLFALGGVLVGLALSFGLPSREARLRGAQQTQDWLDLPVIARIPKMNRRECASPETVENTAVREGANTLATITRTVARELGFKVFSVSSAKIGEGKSTVAIHFAIALARKGFQIALVDGNLRRPALHASLGLDNETGLTSLLESGLFEGRDEEGEESGDAEAQRKNDIVTSVEGALRPALFENLRVLTAGPNSEFPEAAVAGRNMEMLVDTLATMFDFVILDAPSVEQHGEALELVGLSEACVMVVGAGRCQLREAQRAKQLFNDVQTSILGVVLNRYSGEVPSHPASPDRAAESRTAQSVVDAPA